MVNRSKYRAHASDESLALKGQLAVTARRMGRDSDEYKRAERDYTAARLADYIEQLVDQAPPLTKDQKARLVSLIRGGAR